ncbi:MAG TPA: CC/Se motif family (seleno)protein [Patescibacteria group bacterium]|nr:CC/Se motif family (seleno)protein [Patescibacteria group bacterium]
MNLRITDKAKEYIQSEGGAVTANVEQRLMKGCDALKMAGCPTAKLGKPEEGAAGEYTLMPQEGIDVYVHTTMSEFDEATLLLDLETTLFGYNLKIYGGPATGSCLGCSAC